LPDDTNLFVTNEDSFSLNSTANEAINKVNKWFFLANRLSLKVDKTCYMVFTPHVSDCNVNFKLLIGGIQIERVKSCRYLGLIINDDSQWSEHINTINNYLLKYVGIFYKVRNRVPAGVMTMPLFIRICYMELNNATANSFIPVALLLCQRLIR